MNVNDMNILLVEDNPADVRLITEALKENRLEFLPVNLEIAENEHFIDDFQLSARTVVVERVVGGQRGDYLNLTRVWELVGNREAYIEYVQDEMEKFMNGES